MLEAQGRPSVAGRPAWTHGGPGAPIKGTQRPGSDGLVVQGRPPAFRGQGQLGQRARETNPLTMSVWRTAGHLLVNRLVQLRKPVLAVQDSATNEKTVALR